MHLLAQEEYGLRCLVQLARHRGSSPLTIPEIAAAEGLSPEYTAKLMRALRQGGLVMSTRGAAGGYRLARPAEEVTAWEVLEKLDDSAGQVPGLRGRDQDAGQAVAHRLHQAAHPTGDHRQLHSSRLQGTHAKCLHQ